MEKRISKVPENESKNERFKRLVVDRVNKAVKAIDRVGNCAGSGYDYTPPKKPKRSLWHLKAPLQT